MQHNLVRLNVYSRFIKKVRCVVNNTAYKLYLSISTKIVFMTFLLFCFAFLKLHRGPYCNMSRAAKFSFLNYITTFAEG
jgi:hypothetical protein